MVCEKELLVLSQGLRWIYHYTLAVDYGASPSNAVLPCYSSLVSTICRSCRQPSCSSPLCYVIGFLQIPSHDGHPCLDSSFRSPRRTADLHRLELCHASRTSILVASNQATVAVDKKGWLGNNYHLSMKHIYYRLIPLHWLL